ncbi:Folylpolyglutamate synthetase [Coemansia sp. RSA 2559]|nr:Folylpolyglutamate synthetase [Coemansia sp. RSA 2559]KAJ2869061.1 Folylpolyglutamate synthetase [Coemansia erecta]
MRNEHEREHEKERERERETYESAVRDLNGLQTNYQIMEQIRASGGRLNEYSIPEFEAFLEKVGHQVGDLDRLNVIHVTGTKGKGSTCAFVASILSQLPEAAGSSGRRLKVGLFTSPHLIEVRERIQIDGQPIASDAFAKYFYETYNALRSSSGAPLRKVTPESPAMPMYFRFLTLMAYHVFLRESVDVAVVEVGVGGQYDSTNVVRRPAVCGIASLGLDHQGTLGSTIEQIAWHKAGIIKQGVPAYTVSQKPSALAVIRSRAAERDAPLHVVDPQDVACAELGIPGDHQRTNAALAASLCREWVRRTGLCSMANGLLLDRAIDAGLRNARWPGRSQTFVSPRSPTLTWHVDGAHTVESMAACAQWFAQLPLATNASRVLLFNAAHSRNISELLSTLVNHAGAEVERGFCEAVFCPNISRRSDSVNFTVHNDPDLGPQKEAAAVWAQLTQMPATTTTVLPTINDAVAYIEAKYNKAAPTHVLVTGSLHLVGGVLDSAKGSI